MKEVLPHTALLFAPSGASEEAPVNPLIPNAAQGSAQQEGTIGSDGAARQGEQITVEARRLDALATSAVSKLKARGERELDRLAAEFEFQPQQKILAREVQSRAVQVLTSLSNASTVGLGALVLMTTR